MDRPRPACARRTATALAAVAGLFLIFPTATGAVASPKAPVPANPLPANPLPAAQTPADPNGNSDQMDQLNKQIADLEKKYGGDMAMLRDTQTVAKEAIAKQAALQRDLDTARLTLARMAAAQYMRTSLDPMVDLLSGADPASVLDTGAIAGHLARNHAAQVAQIRALVGQQQKAATDAQTKITNLQQRLKNMEAQKAKLKKLVDKFKPQSPLVGDMNLTVRMIQVRTEVDSRFGPFFSIGCYRPGDPQDHGSGHACDFMESPGGVMPTPDRQANGDQVAQWAIDNASRLGIKYIIWKQRIYDMRSPGWSPMSDRGGITANHFDHVHISVF